MLPISDMVYATAGLNNVNAEGSCLEWKVVPGRRSGGLLHG